MPARNLVDKIRNLSGHRSNHDPEDAKMKTTTSSSRKKNAGGEKQKKQEKKGNQNKKHGKETMPNVDQKDVSGSVVSLVSESDGDCDMDEEWTCTTCKSAFKNDSCKIMECERCIQRYCISCLGMSDNVYEYMARDETLWCCDDCCSEVRELIRSQQPGKLNSTQYKLDTAISEMRELIDKVKEFMNSKETMKDSATQPHICSWAQVLEDNTTSGTNQVTKSKVMQPVPQMKDIIKEAIKEQDKEESDRDNRIQNVVLFRAKESTLPDLKGREAEDKDLVNSLLREIGVENEVTVSNVTRLGKKDNRTRPLRSVVWRKKPSLWTTSSTLEVPPKP